MKQDIFVRLRTDTELNYENAQGYQLGSGFLGVIDNRGVLTIFPSDLVECVKVYPIEQEPLQITE